MDEPTIHSSKCFMSLFLIYLIKVFIFFKIKDQVVDQIDVDKIDVPKNSETSKLLSYTRDEPPIVYSSKHVTSLFVLYILIFNIFICNYFL